MARGPKPMPRNLRLLHGGRSASPDRRNDDQPKPALKAPPVPRSLTPEQRKLWRLFVARLQKLRVLAEVDAGAIELWVLAKRRHQEICQQIAEDGMVIEVETEQGIARRRHPLLVELRMTEAALLKIEAEFGLTPSSRNRVTAKP